MGGSTTGAYLNGIENIIRQLEGQRTSIDRALEALREIAGLEAPVTVKRRGRPPGKKKGGMSAEGRARIGEATRERWAAKKAAEAKAAKKTSKLPAQKKVKRSMSAEARARIAESARKMWAKKKAAAS